MHSQSTIILIIQILLLMIAIISTTPTSAAWLFWLRGNTNQFQTATTTSGACTNSQDKSIWNSNKSTFPTDLENCGRKCLGTANCVSKCMSNLHGYSTSCSQCFGMLTACNVEKCMKDCASGRSPQCEECSKHEGCDAGFAKCTGLGDISME
jgi:hypothetical protein